VVGSSGLGQDVLLAIRGLHFGASLEVGASVVLIAITFDRLIKAIANDVPQTRQPGEGFWRRHPHFIVAIAALILLTLLSFAVPELGRLPRNMTVTTAPFWDALVNALVRLLFDYIEAVRTFLVLNVLNPFKNFLLGLPWVAVIGLLGLAGYRVGGRALSLLVVLLTGFCVSSGFL